MDSGRIAKVVGHLKPQPVGAKSESLRGKTLFITGASRGIGLAIAKRAARDGANVVVAAKTAEPHPTLPGTIFTAAKEIEAAGGRALPVVCDIRFEDQVQAAVKKAVDTFGGIDICINNASAISLTPTLATSMKKYDLMHQVNARGTFMVSKACLPYLKKSTSGHILNMSPPLSMKEKWFQPHTAYSSAKYGMSMCTLGMAGELRKDGIAVNSLWPRTAISTAAVRMIGGDAMSRLSRTVDIMADAAYAILTQTNGRTGQFYVDEVLLRSVGVSDFSKYKIDQSISDEELAPDFFVD